jgi:hypothetical protein
MFDHKKSENQDLILSQFMAQTVEKRMTFFFNENGRNQLKWTSTHARSFRSKQHSALLSIWPKLTKSIIRPNSFRSTMIPPFQIRPKEAPPSN